MAFELTPYEISITETSPDLEYPLVQITGEVGLSDVDAIALARSRLQDLIDAIDENPSLLVVKRNIITTTAFNLRVARSGDRLAE